MVAGDRPIPILFGEVLCDLFPDGAEVLGGAPFNVAVHLAAFGARPLMISRVGSDERGWRILAAMRGRDMTTAGIQTDPAHPTGVVNVHLRDGEPSFDIQPGAAWDHIDASVALPLAASVQVNLIYHGTLALRSTPSRATLTDLRDSCRAPVFVDLNLRRPWFDSTIVEESCRQARWLKLNAEELNSLDRAGAGSRATWHEIAREAVSRFGLEFLILTRGYAGAWAYTQAGKEIHVSPEEATDFVDSVGAGDAFSAVCLLGLQDRWTLDVMLDRAAAFAAEICRIRGAIPASDAFYAPFRSAWGTANPG